MTHVYRRPHLIFPAIWPENGQRNRGRGVVIVLLLIVVALALAIR